MCYIDSRFHISSTEFATGLFFLSPDELKIIHIEDYYYFSDRKPVRFIVEASDGTDWSSKFHYTDLGDKYSLKSEELNEDLKYGIVAVYEVSDLIDKPIEQVYILSDDITKKKRKYKKRKFYQPKQRFFD